MTPTKKTLLLTLTIILSISITLPVANLQQATTKAQTTNPAIQLQVIGLVQPSLNLTLEDLKAMPQTQETAILYCVSDPQTALISGLWTGVSLSDLLQQTNISQSAIKLAFHAPDGFSTDLPLQTALENNEIIVAYQKDDQTLGALRLVVPGHWGYKWINDLTQIELVDYNFLGTYENQGYSDDGIAVNVGPRPNAQNNQAYLVPTPTPKNPTQTSTPLPTKDAPVPAQSSTNAVPTNSPVDLNPKTQPQIGLSLYLVVFFVFTLAIGVLVALVVKRQKHI